ncbi:MULTISPECIES: hypothetical protein [Vibrio]|jgi:hypothetical protein|uniref:hypothetical protein n=1 Tax=Vibrio TaxID=662 RepID=UPI0004DD5BE7|nr:MULTISPECIES: hypothetical protein [Vibrio]KFA99563.1 hypothetical protein HW45_02940 [Vibrio sp. ER1A]MCG9658781.1 hypothetical protein [Vibrio mediterranei]MCY9855405.1 hypothetical protein [Vibrio mediterranei]NOI26958.1 hypothetical protein [Vibrio mediterranei]
MQKIIIQFTQDGRYIDNAWEGRFQALKGDQKAVSPSLAMRLVGQRLANAVLGEDGKPLTLSEK